MRAISKGLLRLVIAGLLAFATYWLLSGLLSVVSRWLGFQSGVGQAIAALEVYLSPLLFGFPLLVLLTIVFFVVLVKKGVIGGR
jgi:hypothetical protein